MNQRFERGDIVQITTEEDPWYPALGIVDDVKPWGIQFFVLVPTGNREAGSVNQAFKRLVNGDFKVVGRASILPD